MTEVLLRPNRRALLGGLIFFSSNAALGTLLLFMSESSLRIVGGTMLVNGAFLICLTIWMWRTPRLAYRDGKLLVGGLWKGPPIRLPLDVTECAFLGAGPAQLHSAKGEKLKSANLVIRLDQRAAEWAERRVDNRFGSWTDGYITIRGTWCEPLTLEVVQHINQRLHDLKLQAAQAQTQSAEHP